MFGLLRPAAPATAVVSASDQARIDALGQYGVKRGGFKGSAPANEGSVQAALDQVKAAQAPPKPVQRVGAFGGGRPKQPLSIEAASKNLETAIATAEAQKAAKDAELSWIKSVGGMHHEGRWKHLGRQIEVHAAQGVVPVTAVTAAVVGAFTFGVGGMVVTQLGGGIARVAGAGEAREEGLSGHAAKDKGRQLANKTRKWGGMGTMIGGAAGAAAGTQITGPAAQVASAAGTAANAGIQINNVLNKPSGGGGTAGGLGISVNVGPAAAPAPAAGPLVTKTDFELIALGAAGLLAYAAA